MSDAQGPRQRTVTWQDPAISAALVPTMSGLEFIRGIGAGEIPAPPVMRLLGFTTGQAELGRVEFTADLDESLYNPIGTVHGGVLATLLDSAIACAVQTTLPLGQAYTSLELKVSFLRAVTEDSGPLTAIGRVTKPGSRAAFGEGTVHDRSGRLVATASSTCLVIQA